MTERELRGMGKAELIEQVTRLSREKDELAEKVEKLQAQLKEARDKAASRNIAISNAGSIAEAALGLRGVFDRAQEAADEYLENIRRMQEEQEKTCARLLEETRLKCQEMEIGTQRRCDELYRAAEAEASQKWSSLARALEDTMQNFVQGEKKA
ncbi:MAG: hypothetical protein IJ048_12425 [Clostridia bacterium]|nr:hypothetical protein [Clostridia bacterium]